MMSPTPFIPLTSQQVVLLKKSFRMLDSAEVAKRFYAKLFEKYPEVKPLFPPDTVDLGAKLMSVFELVVFSFEERRQNEFLLQEAIIIPLRQLGRKHEERGVQSNHYPLANALLIESLKEVGGDFFTDDVVISWKLALTHLTETMLNKNVLPSAQTESESGVSLRETFSYIRKRLLGQH